MSTETAPAMQETTGQVTVGYSADGHTATILIDRSSKLNALTLGLLDDLATAAREVATSSARLVIVRTAGEKVFCVGADINHFADLSAAGMWREWIATGHRAFDALAGLPPTEHRRAATASRSAADSNSRSPATSASIAAEARRRAARDGPRHRPRLGRHRAGHRTYRPGPGQGTRA